MRYQMNRPKTDWDPRKYLEYRLFWPYSSGIPGQWMCHQIDTVHGLPTFPIRAVLLRMAVFINGQTDGQMPIR
jgi:hypothetical protein